MDILIPNYYDLGHNWNKKMNSSGLELGNINKKNSSGIGTSRVNESLPPLFSNISLCSFFMAFILIGPEGVFNNMMDRQIEALAVRKGVGPTPLFHIYICIDTGIVGHVPGQWLDAHGS